MTAVDSKGDIGVLTASTASTGRAPSARSSISSRESGHWNLAARERTVVCECFRPCIDGRRAEPAMALPEVERTLGERHR
jgi:hypothetical protein